MGVSRDPRRADAVGAVGVLATVGWALRQDVAVHSQTSRAAVHGGQKCWLGGEAERLRERLRERLLLRERDIAGSAFLLCVRTAS